VLSFIAPSSISLIILYFLFSTPQSASSPSIGIAASTSHKQRPVKDSHHHHLK
jgi:hypothetical protein